jgi:asparagine synthase (glutamine-hydrolysing)
MTSDDGTVHVIFNGAIYNSEALIREHNLTPRSTNDGEVIHFLYQKFGMRFADYLEGMFAVCIADTKRGELILACDQVGIKPLYYCDLDGHRYVASVFSAFPAHMLRYVKRFPPNMVWSSAGAFEGIRQPVHNNATLEELLESSVAQQIPKEVEWGCMLSGGVDSAVIARLAAGACTQLKTFTCGTPDSPDLAAGREVADLLGATHHEITVDLSELPQIVDAVIQTTASIETWTVTAGVATYLTARRAHDEGFKVLLSGEGADELFGGYDEFQDIPPAYLNSILIQYQNDLGATECLRLDRAAMLHSVETRVPYLSTHVIQHARHLPPREKIRTTGGEPIRKYALRKYAATILPDWVAHRRKEEFAKGSCITRELRRIANSLYPPDAVLHLSSSFPSFPISDGLSAWFFSRWLELFGNTVGEDWHSMVERGLFRQPWNIYLPNTIPQ